MTKNRQTPKKITIPNICIYHHIRIPSILGTAKKEKFDIQRYNKTTKTTRIQRIAYKKIRCDSGKANP